MSADEPHGRPQRKQRAEELQAHLKATRADFEERVHEARVDMERQVASQKARLDEVNRRVEARVGRNLLFAVGIGVVLGAIVLVSLIVVKQIFVVLATALVIATVVEFVGALRRSGHVVDLAPAITSAVLITGVSAFADSATRWAALAAGVALVVVWRLVAEMASAEHRPARAVVTDLAIAVFTQLYIPWLAGFATALVMRENGEYWVLAFLILVICVDTGAYASGLTFGKHAMAPRISPNKTWEGFAGAAVVSVAAGVLLSLFMLGMPWWVGVVFGLLLLGSATVGDLTESMIKRDLGIKDMSSWLPGHGGILDRLDSILPSAAVAYGLAVIIGH